MYVCMFDRVYALRAHTCLLVSQSPGFTGLRNDSSYRYARVCVCMYKRGCITSFSLFSVGFAAPRRRIDFPKKLSRALLTLSLTFSPVRSRFPSLSLTRTRAYTRIQTHSLPVNLSPFLRVFVSTIYTLLAARNLNKGVFNSRALLSHLLSLAVSFSHLFTRTLSHGSFSRSRSLVPFASFLVPR